MSNDKHLLNLVKNQTTIVEKTMNILKKNENELVIQSERLRNMTIHIEKTMDYWLQWLFSQMQYLSFYKE